MQQVVSGLKLKCEYYESAFGKTCSFGSEQSIKPGTEDVGFEFVDTTREQKNEVTALKFLTSEVAFVPKEALTAFPKLDMIWLHDTKIEVLTSNFIDDLLKFVQPKITRLAFIWTDIEQINPDAIEIFKTMEYLKFYNNNCIKGEKIFKTSSEFASIETTFKNCTRNFIKACEKTNYSKDHCIRYLESQPAAILLNKKFSIFESSLSEKFITQLSFLTSEIATLNSEVATLKRSQICQSTNSN